MDSIVDTPKEKITALFQKQRARAEVLYTSSAAERLHKLDLIYDYITDPVHEAALKAALYTDLAKPEVEAMTSEIGVLLKSIKDIKSNLKYWMKDTVVSSPLMFLGASSRIHYEPKGVALIISPWNYPFQLCINPLLYAIAGGCTAILKPSEYSISTSQYIADMVASLFEESEVAVCQGGIPTSEALLEQPFDHMYFTGSPTVGKIVMKAAAKHLSSITLELGGKSPCVVDETVNIDEAAKKIVWAKLFNTGQTCIAPDYLLVQESIKEQLLAALEKQLVAMFDPENRGIDQSSDLGRIVNEKHFDKLQSLLSDANEKGAKIVVGGDFDRETRYLAPTIIEGVTDDMDIMQEEIFGPILPVLTYTDVDAACRNIRRKPKPLALYVMSKKQKNIDYIRDHTSSGGMVVNDFLIHFANHNLPFGGVNNSGIGKSHGKYGFLAFSNERAYMRNRFAMTKLLHPPYTATSKKLATLLGKWV